MGRVRAVREGPAWRMGFAATEAAAGAGRLLPEERALVAGSSAARLEEFGTGRHCARTALACLDPELGRMPVLADPRGAPRWPPGTVGSITHCAGWTGAVAARYRGSRFGRGVRSLGLDAEPIAPLPAGVLDVIASDAEREALERLGAAQPVIPWDTLLFSAKEAAYKASYPLTGILLAHDAVSVRLLPSGRFSAVVTADDPGGGRPLVHRVHGRWALGPRVLVALGVIP